MSSSDETDLRETIRSVFAANPWNGSSFLAPLPVKEGDSQE
jgi:hypothetical protein